MIKLFIQMYVGESQERNKRHELPLTQREMTNKCREWIY